MTGRTDAPWSSDPDAERGMRIRFGENLRLLRAHAHISQEELASRADVHRTEITFFETGQRMPMLGTALRLAAHSRSRYRRCSMGSSTDRGSSPRPEVSSRSPHDLFSSSPPVTAGVREVTTSDVLGADRPQPEEGEAGSSANAVTPFSGSALTYALSSFARCAGSGRRQSATLSNSTVSY
jgi:DNA-binding XRE family transcriptional regulator